MDRRIAETGDQLNYTIVLKNTGDKTASGAEMTDDLDDLPSGVVYVEESLTSTDNGAEWIPSARLILWRGDLLPRDEVTIAFSVEIQRDLRQGTIVRNVATIDDGENLTFSRTAATSIGKLYVFLPLLVRACGDWEVEPNDGFSEAFGPLCPGHPYHGTLASDDENDIYYVEATGDFEVRLTEIWVGEDYDLAIWDENEELVDFSSEPGRKDEYVAVRGHRPGRYYIQVFRFEGAAGAPPYSIWWNSLDQAYMARPVVMLTPRRSADDMIVAGQQHDPSGRPTKSTE